jgi:membrane-bound serine protease (ClpP class)
MPPRHDPRPTAFLAVVAALAGCEPAITIPHDQLDVVLAVLTNPWVAGMLLWVGLLGVYLEFKVPGFGVPGITGIVALVVLFGSQYLVGHASLLEILMFVVGLILMVLEVAVIPGFGVVGVAGIACTLLGLVLALQSGSFPDLRIPQARAAMLEALFTVSIGVLGFGGAAALLARFFPQVPGLNRLVQTSDVSARDGFTAELPGDVALVGRLGRALSDLRPSGKIQVGDEILDASTTGEYVEAGTRVRVTRADGNRLLVETEHLT